jgi:hypothetical protein
MIKGHMKKYITILAMSLIWLDLVASDYDKSRDFQTVEDLIAYVRQTYPDHLLYDTNGIIAGVTLPFAGCTDHNLHLLSEIKTLRYLHIFGVGGNISTNGILALAECSNLTGLNLTCCGSPLPSKHLVTALPCLTNLQSLNLGQNSYMTNDTTYLAKMTNLIALEIAGSIPRTQSELRPLTDMVNLRKLLLFSSDEIIKQVETNVFSRFNKATKVVILSGYDQKEEVWKKSFSIKENTTTDQ